MREDELFLDAGGRRSGDHHHISWRAVCRRPSKSSDFDAESSSRRLPLCIAHVRARVLARLFRASRSIGVGSRFCLIGCDQDTPIFASRGAARLFGGSGTPGRIAEIDGVRVRVGGGESAGATAEDGADDNADRAANDADRAAGCGTGCCTTLNAAGLVRAAAREQREQEEQDKKTHGNSSGFWKKLDGLDRRKHPLYNIIF